MGSKVVFLSSPDSYITQPLMETLQKELPLSLVDIGLPEAEKIASCKDAQVLIIGAPPGLSLDLVKASPKLKYIQSCHAGFDYMDVRAITQRGIKVANNSGSIAIAVAEHTIALMLALQRQLVGSWQSARSHLWNQKVEHRQFDEITGKTVGIVGLGHIGREVAKRLRAWDTLLLYYDMVPLSPEVEQQLDVCGVSLEELLGRSDIVSLHLPLNQRTRHIIGDEKLSQMQPTALLINTCRGAVVDEEALIRALREGRIAGAGLDVLEQEPPARDNPLLSMDNVLVTPHVAGTGMGTVRRSQRFLVENVKRMLKGEEPLSLIRFQD